MTTHRVPGTPQVDDNCDLFCSMGECHESRGQGNLGTEELHDFHPEWGLKLQQREMMSVGRIVMKTGSLIVEEQGLELEGRATGLDP